MTHLKHRLGVEDLLAAKRQEILQIAAQHKAHNIRVFGSVARGEATPDSDIDFLVDFEADYTLWDHIGLEQGLSDLLGREVDVAVEKDLREDLKPSILSDAVPL